MSAPVPTAQPPAIAASSTATAAPASSAVGSSADVAAGSAQPTARSYASATKKASSPPIASSAAPPVAVGGPQNAQDGKRASNSPIPALNGKSNILPAVPTIVNSSMNGSQSDHSRKSSVTIPANGGPVSNRTPNNLTFGGFSNSPSPAPAQPAAVPNANLGSQAHRDPRVYSPAHSPSPIPSQEAPKFSGGMPTTTPRGDRPGLSFGSGSESDMNQAHPLPIPQHRHRDSSHSTHSDAPSNYNPNRASYQQNSGRGRGNFNNYSPQQYRPTPHQAPRGGPMTPPFQPQGPFSNSPLRQTRSPNITPASIQQQTQYANPGMPYGYNHPGSYQQQPPNMYGAHQPPIDPYAGAQYYPQNYNMGMGGMAQSMYAPAMASPGRTHQFPQHMQGQHMQAPFIPPYGQPQPTSMSRTPSNISERPTSAVAQPSTPSMSNVTHVQHSHTPSVGSNSPAPTSSNFTIPSKKTSRAITIKRPDGEILDLTDKKAASPAPPKSPVVAATPTPPPRAPSVVDSLPHSRTDSQTAKSASEKQAEFKAEVEASLKKQKEDAEKAAAEAAAKEKEAAEAKAKEEADKIRAEEEERKKAEEAEAAKKAEDDAERKKREEDEAMERMIAEMEAAELKREQEEAEKEKIYLERKKEKEAERKKAEAAEKAAEDERLREAERAAEAAEIAREKQSTEDKAKDFALFASLKKDNRFGPGANAAPTDSGASTPPAEPAASASAQPSSQSKTTATKPKPAALKLETTKPVEPAQPTPAMQSLKSARFLQVRSELVNYPEGIRSPNPALNVSNKVKGRQYDKDFLLQFQDVFKEKPSVDWDMKLKETVGDSTDSARPQSARPSGMGPRNNSRTSLPAGGPMGNFGAQAGFRTLPPGTTSEQRFREANRGGQTMTNPLANFVGGNRPGGFPMAPPMARTGSFQNMAQAGPNSPRIGSSRGRGSRRGDGGKSKKEEEQAAKAMPLTAGMEVKALERSQTGWKPLSQAASTPQPGSNHMAPDMVQRKVKAALNKMTPEKFDKISDQILDIAAQSKDESDGRTLRQVIQLTFEKACDEAHWASMYAKFCQRMLTTMSMDIKDENVKDKHGAPVVGGALFRKYLLNRCQEEFERGWEVNLPEKPEDAKLGETVMLSDEYYVAAAAKRRGLGLIQFIGELYKLQMLTLRIMHECVLKLLDFEGEPDESAIESLVKLLRTVGATMEATETGPKMIAMYFERIEKITAMPSLGSRHQFMLLDIIDLRKKGWKSKDDAKGPKTIAEIHQEAAAAQQAAEMERTRSNQRGGARPAIGRGDARSFSGNMPPPQDFPSGRVGMDDLRKLSKGASGRTPSNAGSLGPSMLGSRSSSGRRGLGPGGLIPSRGEDSNASSRTTTPPVQKEKESTTHMNSFSALAALENNEGAGEVGSPPSTASSPPVQKSAPAPVESKEA